MANDCNNSFIVRHSDLKMIERFRRGWNDDGVFNEFFPIPDELKNGESPCREKALKVSNIRKYGAECWYDWSIKNWGNKRDIGIYNGELSDGDNGLSGWFESAWGPPIEAFIRLGELGFTYELYYDEPGSGFVGKLTWDGLMLRDECYEYDFEMLQKKGLNWKGIIPEEFHEVAQQHYAVWLESQGSDAGKAAILMRYDESTKSVVTRIITG